MSVTLCLREDTGERDALFIDCRGPAANASRRRRDRSRIQLRDATRIVAMFSSLIARGVRQQYVAADRTVFRSLL